MQLPYISIREIARILHPSRNPEKRHIVIFEFYCDESHDNPKVRKTEPKNYVVGGFFGSERAWRRVESCWASKNERVNVLRFHAAHLNAGTYEYEGWGENRRLRYSKDMLRIIKDQKQKLHGFAYGIHVDDYRRIISSDGQRKMGHPYLVCFKAAIASVAQQMDMFGFPKEDKVAVLIDHNAEEINIGSQRFRLDAAAVNVFNETRDSPACTYRHRLATCTPGASEDFVCLQPADFVAYEMFRLIQNKRNGIDKVRQSLETMLGVTPFMCELFNADSLERLKDDVDKTQCNDGALTVIPAYRKVGAAAQ